MGKRISDSLYEGEERIGDSLYRCLRTGY